MGAGWDTAVQAPPVHPPPPSSVEAVARAILAERQFRPPPRSIPQAVWHWISAELSSLFAGLGGGGRVPGWVGLVIVAVVVAAALIGLARGGAFRRRTRRPRVGETPLHVSAEDLGIGAETWVERAVVAEAAGEWREGLRCRHRSVLARLAAAHLVTEEVGRTVGEYRRLVATALPPAADAFGAATTVFEASWYGAMAAGPDQRDRLVATTAQVEAALAHRRRAGRTLVGVASGSGAASGGSGAGG